ncbi:MAG: ATP-binding cassette domain-containing protein [Clostridia bacterium]|nr:ATP-binding cassette domain-containing protein [Clostridia bacterium]
MITHRRTKHANAGKDGIMSENQTNEEFVLKTVNLSKKYKDTYAVRGVNMTIRKGDIYGFVGENGAGKTTVIRLITGLAAPTEGTFQLFGKERFEASQMKRVAGIVENVSLNRSMTAVENLKYQCYICGITKTKEELESVLADVGLPVSHIGNKTVKNFSLGMRQRLGIASVIIQDPEFVLLDEPMNGLDPQGFVDMRNTIVRLNKKGITFLISSHILSELDKVCNRIGLISKGVLLDEVSVETLHSKSSAKTLIGFDSPAEAAAAQQKFYANSSVGSSVLEGCNVTVYGNADINEIMAFLVSENIRISSINLKEKTVEDYYVEKVRGQNG